MKTIFSFIVFVFLIHNGFAQTDCRPYLPTDKGTIWEITNYTSKGKETGKMVYELVDKAESGNNITFTVKNTTYDKKGEEVYSSTFDAKCVDGKFEFDMTYKMDGAALQAFQDMDIQVDASEFEIPSMDETPGTQLADGTLEIQVGAGEGFGINMTVFITERLVEAKENITTPAGSFDCIVLSQKVSTKMLIRVNGSSKEWYSENIGMVRSESYNKKGKLLGYSELTRLEQQ
jgi:DUF3108-like